MAFKMKGSSLYGKVNLNRGGQENRPDGRAKSSSFQMDEKSGAPMKKSPMEKGKTSVMGKLKALGKGINTALRASATENLSDSFRYAREDYKKSKKESREEAAKKKKGATMKKDGAPMKKGKEARMRGRLEKRTKKGKGPKVNVRSANLEDKINKKYPKKNVEESFGPSNSNSKTYLYNDSRFKDMDRNPDGTKKKQGAPKLDEGGGQGGKKTKYKNTLTYKNDEKTTAETNTSKKNLAQKIFGGKTNKTTTTSRGAEDVNFTRSSEKTREDRKGRTRKKVTVGPKGKKTVTRYKKDGSVKSNKVKKGTHKVKGNRMAEKDAIRTADAKSNNVYTGD